MSSHRPETAKKARDPDLIGAEAAMRRAAIRARRRAERVAWECIDAGDWAGGIRESIHAVESVARRLDPRATTLDGALRSLEANLGGTPGSPGRAALHPALGGAFRLLYGYTSEEDGIRHALLDDDDAGVGRDEAVFMFGACASFAGYLWRKHNPAGSQGV